MRTHALRISYYLLFAVIAASSVLYLLADIKTYDVIPSVRSYGAVQLALTLVLVLMLVLPSAKRYPKAQPVAFSVFLWILLLIQTIPALLWILFDGRAVAEYPWDRGVVGSWVFGVYHIAVMAWGIVNFLRRRPTV